MRCSLKKQEVRLCPGLLQQFNNGRILAYGVLQFTMDLAVMSAILVLCVSPIFFANDIPTLTIFYSMFFKYTHEDAEPSRAPNLTCFSIIFSLSLTGAVGLTIGSSGDGFCEEFLSTHPDTCMEASLVLGMSWASAAIGKLMYLS